MRIGKLRNMEKQARHLIDPPLIPLVYWGVDFPLDTDGEEIEDGVLDLDYEKL